MTRKALLIGSHIKMAASSLQMVHRASPTHPSSPTQMFYAAENLLMAVLTSEGIDAGAIRRKFGNHQLDRMVDELPDMCAVRIDFEKVIDLVAYATTYRYPTPSGRIPDPPSTEEAERFFAGLKSILEKCTLHYQVDVKLDQPVAGRTTPPR